MKYGDYFSKIEDIFKNLQNQLDEFQIDYLSKQEEFTKKLLSDKETSKSKLELLEKKYQQNDENNNQNISKIKSIIQHLQSELDKQIADYNSSHNSIIDKEKILGKKEVVLTDFKQAKKKSIFDLNQRINTIDRECILSLKAKVIEYEEEKNLFKNKLNDIEKKMRFEIQKIENEILSPEIKTNSDEESTHNYQNTKEIREYRKNGILEISKIKKKYYKDIRDLEIKFAKYEGEFNRDNIILREEYNLQIEALKYEKLKIQREIEKTNVDYDFDAYRQSNLNEKTYKEEKAAFKQIHLDKVKEYQKQINLKDKDYNKESFDQTVDLLNNVTIEDNVRFDDIYSFLVNTYNTYYENTNKLNELLKTIIDDYLKVFENLLVTHWQNIYTLENSFYNSLLLSTYHTYSFKEFNYNDYRERVKNLYKDFKTGQKERLANFNKLLKNSINKMLDEVLVISKNYRNYMDEELNNLKKYYKLFKDLNGSALKDGILSANSNFVARGDQIKTNYQNVNINLDNYKQEIENDLKFSKDEYHLKTKELEEKIKKYYTRHENALKSDKLAYDETVANINNNIKQAKRDFIKNYRLKRKEANKKFENELKTIEKDQKTRIKMGQI